MPVFVVRFALCLVGVGLLLLGGGDVSTIAWAMIAVAVTSELLATAVFLHRRRGG